MRLLLAEDEQSLAKAISTLLIKNNYSVDVVHDGEAALEYLETNNYDGVILDIMMPKRDGISVLQTIRKESNMVPVLMLTAKSEIDDKVEGLDSGANDYLTKPFAIRELLARIRAMTRNQIEQPNSKLHVGNITLDSATYTLSSAVTSFQLANKEYQMIEMLMRNQGQVIATEQFLEKIWGYESDVEVNIVWTYISYLRKKLTALHAEVQIKAKRNIGYSLEEVS